MTGLAIAHVTNSFRADGTGITNLLADLAMTQASEGHRVAVLCDGADDSMRSLASRHGVTVIEGVLATTPRQLLAAALGVAPRLGAADVVHVHTVRAALVSLLASPWRHVRASVATVHNPYKRSSAGMFSARRVVCLSEIDRRAVRRQSLGLRRPAIVRNATVGSPRTSDVEPLDLPEHSIVYVGALTHRKGVDVLLRAMSTVHAAVPGARLFLVGNRDNLEMEALSAELGLGDVVTFVGFERQPGRYLAKAAVFALPARADGFPLALLEARSWGVPVVASRVGGIPEALSDGTAGLLIPPDDQAALAEALVGVLTDASFAESLRRASRHDLERMTVQRMTDEYDRVYATMGLRVP